jgi:hypothetical protein
MDKFRLKDFGGPEEGTAEDAVKCLTDLQARLASTEAALRDHQTQKLTDGRGGEVVLLAEEIGMPSITPPKEIAREVVRLYKQNEELATKLTAAQDLIKKSGDAVKSMERMKAEYAIDEAVRKQYLDAVERDFAIKLYEKDPVETQKWINSRSYKAILAHELGSGSEIEDLSPVEELSIKAKELIKANPKLSLAQAESQVMGADVELAERYNASVLAGKAGK